MDPVPLAGLEREWRALVAGPLAVRFRSWRGTDPVLAGFSGPAAVIKFLRGPAPAEAKDRALAGLLARAREEPLAGRVVLEALMPGLKRLVGRLGPSVVERDEVWQLVLAAAWERIRTYPLERRPRRIAANLLLDTLHAVLGELKRERHCQAELGETALEAPLRGGRPVDVEAVLARAVAAGVIKKDEAELILETEIDGVSLSELAKRDGFSYNALKIRRQRAEQRLLVFLGYLADPKGRSKRPSSGADGAASSPSRTNRNSNRSPTATSKRSPPTCATSSSTATRRSARRSFKRWSPKSRWSAGPRSTPSSLCPWFDHHACQWGREDSNL